MELIEHLFENLNEEWTQMANIIRNGEGKLMADNLMFTQILLIERSTNLVVDVTLYDKPLTEEEVSKHAAYVKLNLPKNPPYDYFGHKGQIAWLSAKHDTLQSQN